MNIAHVIFISSAKDWYASHLKHSLYKFIDTGFRDAIFEVIRSSCFMVCSEFALEPLRAAVTKMGPEVDALCKQRNLDVKDFDSYTRRLKGLLTKKEQFDAQGKGNSPAALENDAEIEKFQLKAATGEEQYNASNAKAKKEIVSAKKSINT